MLWLPIRNFSGSIDGKGISKVNNLGLNTTIANSGFIGTEYRNCEKYTIPNVRLYNNYQNFGVVTGTNRGGTLQKHYCKKRCCYFNKYGDTSRRNCCGTLHQRRKDNTVLCKIKYYSFLRYGRWYYGLS